MSAGQSSLANWIVPEIVLEDTERFCEHNMAKIFLGNTAVSRDCTLYRLFTKITTNVARSELNMVASRKQRSIDIENRPFEGSFPKF